MPTIRFNFDEIKTTQAAAFLLEMAGGKISYLALIKLLYLADRAALERSDYPITGDRYVSMKNGPVLSKTKDLIHEDEQKETYWSKHISPPSDYCVSLRAAAGIDELCDFETEILQEIYSKYGRMDRFKLADLTHEICPEWKGNTAGAIDITPNDILIAIGRTEEDIQRIYEDVMTENCLDILVP